MDRQSTSETELVEDLILLVQRAKQPNSVRSKLSRAANILRYYRTSQLLQRAVRTAAPVLFSRPLPRIPLPGTVRVRACVQKKMQHLAATRSVRTTLDMPTLCDDLSRGKFTLLQQPCELGTPIDWHGRVKTTPSHLWRFQLHYHEYLLDLAVGSMAEESKWPVIWKIVADWIQGNPLEAAQLPGDAWHPYCLSRRLPVWAQLFALCEPPVELRNKFLQSFACQAEVLSKTLEFDLGGNHLLENLTALALAGAFLEGTKLEGTQLEGTQLEGAESESWLDLATRHLRKQLPPQVSSHGEHYERAPMYHCQVLGNLLQVAFVTSGLREDLAAHCRETASKMYVFLQSILHPDGEIPLFGDSCWGEAHTVDDIAAMADLVGIAPVAQAASSAAIVGPYWTWRHAGDALILDAGPVGANSLPAHAHCDLLGFEASIGGQRWFVDSGLFDYNEGEMRDYCRSSVAHNGVTVESQNCCDVWSRFRMGRRGRVTRFEHGQQGGFSWCQASQDGYRHFGVPELSRLMVMHTSGVWTCLEYARRDRDARLIGRLHLAPGIQLQQLDPQRMFLSRNGNPRWLTVTAGVELGLAAGWYCDRFGQRARTKVITYRLREQSNRGCVFGWSLSPSAETTASVTIAEHANGRATSRAEIALEGSSEFFHKQFSH